MAFILTLAMIAIVYFGIKKYRKNKNLKKEENLPITSLNDIFQTDFHNFNSADYKYVDSSKDGNSTNYTKKFRKKEANIFDSVFVNQEKEGLVHYYFSTKNFNTDQIQVLTNRLFKVFGLDDAGKSHFSSEDQKELKQKDFFWVGRQWQNNSDALIKIDAYEKEGLTLVVTV